MTDTTHYPVSAGPLGGRYVHAKLATMRKAREWSIQPTSDDRIIVQTGYGSKGAIGIFGFDGVGRLTTKGAHFPHLALATPYTFPAGFVAACLDVSQPLDSESTYGGVTVAHTVQVF
jgi:hypothetical protein